MTMRRFSRFLLVTRARDILFLVLIVLLAVLAPEA
jgi:hypothetical protein